LYTIKPTLKIVSQDNIIPVSLEADSAGPMTKSVLDLANLLEVLVNPEKTTIPEGEYSSAITASWDNIRIGLIEPSGPWLFPDKFVKYEKEASDQMVRSLLIFIDFKPVTDSFSCVNGNWRTKNFSRSQRRSQSGF
jgi:amidase